MMHRRRIEVSTWALGDWLIKGQEWDERFEHSRKITGYTPGHLYNVRRVAWVYPPHVRNYNLSFAAHLALLTESDPEKLRELYARAVVEHWTVDEVKQHFAANPPTGRKASTPTVYKHVQVKCPCCGEVFPIKGNKC